VRPCGVTAPCVVILSGHALESCGLVDRNAAGTVLVFEVWVLYRRAEGGELVRLPESRRRFWFWSGEIMKGLVGRYRWGHDVWGRWRLLAETDTGRLWGVGSRHVGSGFENKRNGVRPRRVWSSLSNLIRHALGLCRERLLRSSVTIIAHRSEWHHGALSVSPFIPQECEKILRRGSCMSDAGELEPFGPCDNCAQGEEISGRV